MALLILPNFVARFQFTWQEVLYGLEHQFLSVQGAVAVAIASVVEGSSDPTTIELASLDKNDLYLTRELLEQMADSEPRELHQFIKQKWIYIRLSYLFANLEDYPDPFAIVDEIYVDENYPDEITAVRLNG